METNKKPRKMQTEKAQYNLPEVNLKLKIVGNEVELKDLTFKYQKQILQLIDEDLLTQFNEHKKEGHSIADLIRNFRGVIKELVINRLPTIINIIAQAYNIETNIDEIEEKMSLEQMLEVLLLQFERNTSSSKVVSDFFSKMIQTAINYLIANVKDTGNSMTST